MKTCLIGGFVFLLFVLPVLPDDNAYVQEIEKWQQKRFSRLKADDGWPTVAGLFWLQNGANRVGSDDSLPVVLPSPAPKSAGILKLEKGQVQFEPEKGATSATLEGKPVTSPVEMISDANAKGKPTTLRFDSVSFFIIQRGEKIGVRVRDTNALSRKQLSSLQYYAIDPAWRVESTFEAYEPAKKIPMANVLGMVEDTEFAGALAFQVNGTSYRLDVMQEEGEKEGERVFFVIFADKTNGTDTYGAGRYLYTTPLDKTGKVALDFNKAYSPPCAFTNYATCLLPPKQNKLPIPIHAGEKYHGPAH